MPPLNLAKHHFLWIATIIYRFCLCAAPQIVLILRCDAYWCPTELLARANCDRVFLLRRSTTCTVRATHLMGACFKLNTRAKLSRAAGAEPLHVPTLLSPGVPPASTHGRIRMQAFPLLMR